MSVTGDGSCCAVGDEAGAWQGGSKQMNKVALLAAGLVREALHSWRRLAVISRCYSDQQREPDSARTAVSQARLDEGASQISKKWA